MREELRRFLEDAVTAPLATTHRRRFGRRLRRLHPILLPDRDNGPTALASLANGAFASFANEATYPGPRPAFRFAYDEFPDREPGLLYDWRDSATHRYLRSIADDVTRAYLRIVRNVRLNLRRGFVPVGTLGHQAVYAPIDWDSTRTASRDSSRLATARCDPGLRGGAALRAVFEAVGCPLTAVQIASVLWASQHPDEAIVSTSIVEGQAIEPQAEDGLIDAEIRERARKCFSELTDLERQILRARGYGDADARRRSFPEVAAALGRYGPERYRQIERAIFEVLQERFEPNEREIVAKTWAELIGAMHDARPAEA